MASIQNLSVFADFTRGWFCNNGINTCTLHPFPEMNICFFSREYPPESHQGGIATYSYNMAMALTKFGHTVHVITSTRGPERAVQKNGIRVHRIKHSKLIPKELNHLIYSYSVSHKIQNAPCKFDIAQSTEFGSEAFWFSLKKRCPLVTRLATPFFLTEKLSGRAFIGPRPFLSWMEKKQTMLSNGILCSTTALANVVTEKWGIERSKIKIIPNGIDLSRVKQLGENKPVINLPAEKDFLIYFGRLEERKGVRILAHALPEVFNRFHQLQMLFVGSDLGYRGASFREYIRKIMGRHHEKVIFFDRLPQEELFPMIKRAKIVILPSLWEAFGFVCVEAMALGRPVIATSGSGFQEIIDNNVSGYLIEPGNADRLSKKIIAVLKDKENLARISHGASKRAQDFEVSKIASTLSAYYEEVIKDWAGKKRFAS